jgi:alpha-L-fucosidase
VTPPAAWFQEARFGLFVHWGHYAQHGWEASWPLVGGNAALPLCPNVPVGAYHSSASSFAPRRGSPRDWIALARRAGMRYAVLTAKHHDGFALFATKRSDFSVVNGPYRGDIVREFVDATREAGLRVGLYFSLCDWHHPDYPAFREEDKPYGARGLPKPTPEQWSRYLDFLFGQIRELLTSYGRIDLLWFDGGWERSAEQWRARELEDMIRALQPEIVLNDRLPGAGDYATPEQIIPAKPLPGPWESCLTMNESWGWVPYDTAYKSARELVHSLCETASRGGNLLLNVSPRGDGTLPPEQVERLEALSGWMERYAASIVGTGPGLEPWQFHGPSTRRGERIFLHLLARPYEEIAVRGIPVRRVRAVRHLATGAALEHRERISALDRAIRNPDPVGELRIRVPEALLDPFATVIELEIRGPGPG